KKQFLYNHFNSKDDLFLKVMEQVLTEESLFLNNHFSNYSISVEELLKSFLLTYKERFMKYDYNIKFLLGMAYLSPINLKGEATNRVHSFFLKIENLVKSHFLESSQYSSQAEKATSVFMTAFHGLIIALVNSGVDRFDSKLQFFWELYWAGLE